METHGIAVFDVCGTITKTNNTFHFISFVLRRDRPFQYGLLVLLRILRPFFRLPGIRSIFRRDLLRDGQITLLRGYPGARIREMAELYVNDVFTKGLLNDRILDAIQQEKNQGKTVLLVSSAIDPPIAEIARRLNIEDYFSSELEMQDGHYTGRLKTDLLGHKQSILKRMPANVDWQGSSVYSDNLEDSDFMERFGQRNVVLNARTDRQTWGGWVARYGCRQTSDVTSIATAERSTGHGQDGRATQGRDALATEEFRFLVNYDEGKADKDVDSVNERTVKWVYVPLLYYLISRFHREGVFTLLLREIVPVTLTSCLFTSLGAFSFLLLPLSFLMFYSIYEIGGLVNDLAVPREAPGQGGTSRIAPEVHLNVGLFIALRLALVGLLLAWLSAGGYPVLFYLGAISCCLGIFFLHTLILSHRRVLTFLLLKICRNSIPLSILASRVPPATLVSLCAIFSALDAPWRVYMYCRSRGLVRGTMPVGHVRRVNTAILWGLGAVLYLVYGSPYLLVIASYYAVLDCLAIVCRK